MKALVLAAGLGTRLKPWTLHHPKALAEVNNKPLLQRTIQYLQQAGIKDVIVNVHHFATQIIYALEKNQGWGSHYQISDESNLLMDTGGAIMKAEKQGLLDRGEDFLVVNADILTDLSLEALVKTHEEHKYLATLAVSNRNSSRRLLFDKASGLLGGWEHTGTGKQKMAREMKAYQELAFSGIHILNGQLLELFSLQGAFNGSVPFSIIDAYLWAAKEWPIGFYDHSGAKFIDTGTPERLAEAAGIFE